MSRQRHEGALGRALEAVSEARTESLRRPSVAQQIAAANQAIEQQREQAGGKLTDSVLERARERGIDAESAVESGDPADVITDYAEDKEIDVIVLGARGRSAVGKFLLGDVAGKVARHATTPVLLVRAEQ